MVAINKKTREKFQVTKYSLRVIEKGSDTDFGKDVMWIYLPLERTQIKVNRSDYRIVDNWNIKTLNRDTGQYD